MKSITIFSFVSLSPKSLKSEVKNPCKILMMFQWWSSFIIYSSLDFTFLSCNKRLTATRCFVDSTVAIKTSPNVPYAILTSSMNSQVYNRLQMRLIYDVCSGDVGFSIINKVFTVVVRFNFYLFFVRFGSLYRLRLFNNSLFLCQLASDLFSKHF